ncbi:MAG: mechanosensitive ion channel family protein [Candidatus Auribacterota bacterium]|nr:mechanosensitive ion channel family protein [Candidatus Auribacterota bacterium]
MRINSIIRLLAVGTFILIGFGGVFTGTFAGEEDLPIVQNHDMESIRYIARLSSPRATWNSLITLVDRYYSLIRVDGYTSANSDDLEYLEIQISDCFDLRGIAPTHYRDIAMETAVYIREITARFSPLPPDYLPDEDQVYRELKEGHPPVWRIGDTFVEIELIKDGLFAHDFQLSSRTIQEALRAFKRAVKLPYLQPGVKGLYEAYFFLPGPWIPDNWIRNLPGWMGYQYQNNTIWQWSLAILILLLMIPIFYLVRLVIDRVSRGRKMVVRDLFPLLKPIIVILITLGAVYFLDEQIFITGNLLILVGLIKYVIVLISSIRIVISIGNILSDWIIYSPRFKKRSIDTYLIRLGLRLAAIAVSVIAIFWGLQKMGFSMGTVLAGAGATGLALALAARESLSNIFGGLMLLLDKPFKVGERVRIRGHNGTIEGIGLRSTRIRLLNGHLASLPNEDVARADIENIGARPFIRRVMNVTITYDTTPEKIDEAMEIIRDILSAKEDDEESRKINGPINSDPNFPPRMFFNELNSDSLNILVIYWYKPAKYWDYLAYCHYVNRELIRRFNQAGIEFAFPTQTLHIAGEMEHSPDTDIHESADTVIQDNHTSGDGRRTKSDGGETKSAAPTSLSGTGTSEPLKAAPLEDLPGDGGGDID